MQILAIEISTNCLFHKKLEQVVLGKLSSALQNNPITLTIMFLISLISGVIGITLGWKQFYDDYLSNSISIPVWLALAFAIIFLMLLIFRPATKKPKTPQEIKIVEGKEFGVQRIAADGFHFKRCVFNRSQIIISGREPFAFTDNTMIDCCYTFSDEAATTLRILTIMYADENMRSLIEGTIENIKEGVVPMVPVAINHP